MIAITETKRTKWCPSVYTLLFYSSKDTLTDSVTHSLTHCYIHHSHFISIYPSLSISTSTSQAFHPCFLLFLQLRSAGWLDGGTGNVKCKGPSTPLRLRMPCVLLLLHLLSATSILLLLPAAGHQDRHPAATATASGYDIPQLASVLVMLLYLWGISFFSFPFLSSLNCITSATVSTGFLPSLPHCRNLNFCHWFFFRLFVPLRVPGERGGRIWRSSGKRYAVEGQVLVGGRGTLPTRRG